MEILKIGIVNLYQYVLKSKRTRRCDVSRVNIGTFFTHDWLQYDMNIEGSETAVNMVAKTCGGIEKRKIAYAFSQGYHDLCLDKKDIVSAQLEACERLLKYASDQKDIVALDKEIKELKMALDLMT